MLKFLTILCNHLIFFLHLSKFSSKLNNGLLCGPFEKIYMLIFLDKIMLTFILSTLEKIITPHSSDSAIFCFVWFFLLSLRFSQSYHLPIFTFSTVNFRFQREIKFHTFTISAESSIDSFSRRLERTVDFFSFHTHTSHSGERRKSTSKSPPEQLTT